MRTLHRGLRRFHVTYGYYHIALRCKSGEQLITSVEDRRIINAIASETLRRFDATLHAYCLLPDQLRALIQIDEHQVARAMRRIVTRYSRYRQRQSPHLIQLFARPYEAQRVETYGEFLNLLRCIHLSPVIANEVVMPFDYRWSSHRAYLGYKSAARITTDLGLSLLNPNPAQARVAYQRFVVAGLATNSRQQVKRADSANDNSAQVAERSRIIETLVAASGEQQGSTQLFAMSEDPLSQDTVSQEAPSLETMINLQTELPSKRKFSLLRFARHRKRASLRHLSVY